MSAMKRLVGFGVVCLGLAVSAAILTRPSRASFEAYLQRQLDAAGQPTPFKTDGRGLANNISADAYLQTVQVHEHLLWTGVEQDGRPQYVGAYNHWFKRAK